MSKPTLYYNQLSGPCRTVLIVRRMLDIDMELKYLDLMQKEQLSPEFLEINPFHRVPTFVDTDGFTLDESRVIAKYLIETRQPDHYLYPKDDLKKRTMIDRWLQYDISLYNTIAQPMYAKFHNRTVDDHMIENGKKTLETLETAMKRFEGKFLAESDQLTLADIAMYSTLNALEIYPEYFKLEDYPTIHQWYRKVDELMKQNDSEGKLQAALDSLKEFVAKLSAEKQ